MAARLFFIEALYVLGFALAAVLLAAAVHLLFVGAARVLRRAGVLPVGGRATRTTTPPKDASGERFRQRPPRGAG